MQHNQAPIIVGRIAGVYGVKGWVKVMSYTRPKENILGYSSWLISLDNSWQKLDIEESRKHNGRLLIKVVGIDSPEDARKLINSDLAIMREQLPPLKEGEYYWYDLIGLNVLNQNGITLGNITDILETGANDVLVIEGQNWGKILIPLIKNIYVMNIDLGARVVNVEWQLDDDLSA